MSIHIFILSKLMKENNYPYKLKKQLSEPIPLDKLGGLTESKLYYHFDSLAKQGLIETVEIIREEHRPDKQVFGITAKGREELPGKIYKLFDQADDIRDMVLNHKK
ncbi:PadR family transcriptional regulator [Rossellomorea yichunensis]|jgi:DNA-binding PadR family transcriptional regulator|uniref:PadR family transcriptional regulator n=1 Tax=Rossellomorea yichunensis TaxID=3077331 RepID=UPI0028E06C57|nr:helix-turn-helix transcriptional regulator [Rossellomorea sp. YC4-1]MDT9025558.1 helix-turn-helix transcriptional regulator [Rossellomorea sp. YC4-1]